jgi:hypothetical protein
VQPQLKGPSVAFALHTVNVTSISMGGRKNVGKKKEQDRRIVKFYVLKVTLTFIQAFSTSATRLLDTVTYCAVRTSCLHKANNQTSVSL